MKQHEFASVSLSTWEIYLLGKEAAPKTVYQQSNDSRGTDTRGQQLTLINHIDLSFILAGWSSVFLCCTFSHSDTVNSPSCWVAWKLGKAVIIQTHYATENMHKQFLVLQRCVVLSMPSFVSSWPCPSPRLGLNARPRPPRGTAASAEETTQTFRSEERPLQHQLLFQCQPLKVTQDT